MKDIIVVSRADLARERQAIVSSGRRVVSEHALPSGSVMLKVKPDHTKENNAGATPSPLRA